MKIGIDKLGFYTSDLYVDMKKLALARNEDPKKYLVGLGQEKMAVIPPTQDPVTLAANAADRILTPEDKRDITYVLFATESGIDNSKAAAIYAANLLGLGQHVRTAEIKQACYGATAAIHLAHGYLALHPDEKVLILASDIARYGLHTKGEPTQGGGAVAILMSINPHLLAIENDSGVYTEDIMDFWRPLGRNTALVDGHYSTEEYLKFLKKSFNQLRQKSGFRLDDFQAFVFHLPFGKLGKKAADQMLTMGETEQAADFVMAFEISRQYGKVVGNLYTGSLYLALLSLLENDSDLRPGNRVGLFSYGSGAIGDFYSGIVQPWFTSHIYKKEHQEILANRREVSVEEYEKLFEAAVLDDNDIELDISEDPAKFVFTGVKDHKRIYKEK